MNYSKYLYYMLLFSLRALNIKGISAKSLLRISSNHIDRFYKNHVLHMSTSNIEDLITSIQSKGEQIKSLKSLKPPTLKEDLAPLVTELLSLKETYKKVTGEDYGGVKKEETKTKNVPNEVKQPVIIIQPNSDVTFPKNKNYFDIAENDEIEFGDYTVIASNSHTKRVMHSILDLGRTEDALPGKPIWIRGRVSNVRAKGNTCFVVLRSESFYTVQACHFKDKQNPDNSKGLIKFVEGLALESVVDIYGTVASANVKSCTQSDIEIQIRKLFVVSRAPVQLPFLLEDANRPEAEIEASQSSDRPYARVGQDLRLNNRWLDLRVPANNAIMRIKGGVSFLFRESLMLQGFTEIITPKLISGESEGGAGVFRTDYFGKTACLAQSPQLYKQMAISADLERVFEIGPVFRAENSNTRRHLCEFTGLDLEMSIVEHYDEILEVIHKTFRHIFENLEHKYAKELSIVREQYPSEPIKFTEKPLIIHWADGLKMLKDAGVDHGEFEDLSTSVELTLGELVKKKFDADFYILDQYPSAVRPFYTMPSPHNNKFSNSYDIFIRGQEICSGAQRCHEADLLIERIKEKGIDIAPLSYYIESFRHGVKPHGGAGIGLERVVFLYLGLDNVRKASMFPRDPGRCEP